MGFRGKGLNAWIVAVSVGLVGAHAHAWNDVNEGCCKDQNCPMGGPVGETALSGDTYALCPSPTSTDEECRAARSWFSTQPTNGKSVKFLKYNKVAARQKLQAEIDRARSTMAGALKEPFRKTFLMQLEIVEKELPDTFTDFTDPVEDDEGICKTASETVAETQRRITSAYDSAKRMQEALDSEIKIKDPQGSKDALPIPDPNLPFRAGKILRRYNGKPAEGPDDAQKTRNYLAEMFERMVRIFIAGSDQLQQDMPGGQPISPRVLGLYEGHRPDLMNSTSEKVVYVGKNLEWDLCSSAPNTESGGVANPSNTWFKNSGGSLAESITKTPAGTQVSNHRCANKIQTKPEFTPAVIARGMAIQTYMELMETIKKSMKAGTIPAEASLGTVMSLCLGKRGKIEAMRIELLEEMEKLRKGQTTAKFVECADQLEQLQDGTVKMKEKSATLDSSKGMQGSAACDIAQAQNLVELNLTLQYAYCVWYSVGNFYEQKIMANTVNTGAIRRKMQEALACHRDPGGTDHVQLSL